MMAQDMDAADRIELIKTQLEIDGRWLEDIPIAKAIIDRYTELVEMHLDQFGPQPAQVLRLRLIAMLPDEATNEAPPMLQGAPHV